jgi:drug/metabolite transporter (DMT)-like permease
LDSLQVYSLAIVANLTFSSASMIFALYARRFSSMWINQVKIVVALPAFMLAMYLTGEAISVNMTSAWLLLLSGFAGLCIGDLFLFRAFATLGAGRTLILFSCQPLMIGIYGYFFLGQIFSSNQTIAVMCMIICIFIFMVERNKLTGSWDMKSFTWAFLGISLDALGVMLTRSAYEYSPEIETYQVNVIRCLGGVAGFLMISPTGYFTVAKDIIKLKKRETTLLFGASLCGCFISLALYLAALKHAHVGTLTAISITGPVWVALLECIYHRKLPNYYLLWAFAFFLVGFYLMLES